MAKIQGIQIWENGVTKTAEEFNLRSIGDDLSFSANFYYELREADVLGAENTVSVGQILRSGNLAMDIQEYEAWDNSNESAYTWAAGKLNITLV